MVENIAKGLEKNGHEAVIITTRPFFSNKTINDENNIRFYHIRGFYYDLKRIPKFFRFIWHFIDMFDLGSYLRVKNILKIEKPNIVITHNLKGIGYLIPRAIKGLKIKHIHTLHDIQLLHPLGLLFKNKENILDGFFSKIYQRINIGLFKSTDIVLSPSKWLLQLHASRGFFQNSRRAVIANPVNIASDQQSHDLFSGNNLFKFLYVGQVDEYKGVFLMIEAFNELNAEGGEKNLELIIIGDGREFKKAQNMVAGKDNIKLLGRKSREETDRYMSISNCLLMPSLCYENSPMVIYEAFASKLPVLASNIGGIPEVFEGGAGILFEAGNKKDLIRQMKWAVEHREKLKNTGEQSGEKIKDSKIDNYVKKLINIIK